MKNQKHHDHEISATNFNQMNVHLQELIQYFTKEHNFIAKILDTVAALVIVIDPQGRIIHFNQACEQTTKYSFLEVQNRYFWEFLSLPESENKFLDDFLKLQPDQFPFNYEGYLLTKDEKKRLISWSINVLIDDAKNINYIIATGIDITETRQAEIELKHNEERFRIMVEGSEQVFFYIHDNDHVFQYLSPSVQTVLGYKPEELIGQTCECIIVDNDEKEKIFNLVDSVLLTGERSDPYTVFCRHKNGQILFTEIVETPMAVDGKVVGMQGFVRDITKRRIAEIQLCENYKRDRLVAEIVLKIRRSLDLQEILNTTVTEIRQFLQTDRALISNFNPNWHRRVFAESTAPEWELVSDLFLQDNDYIQELTNLFSQLNLLQVDDISKVNISPKRTYYFHRYQVKSCLAVPIMLGDEFFGTLVVHQCSRVRHWQQTEIELLQQLANQVAIAIQQAKLFQEIQTLNINLERKVEERTAQLQDKMTELENLYKQQDEFLHAVSHDLRTPITGTMMLLKHWQQSNLETISLSRNILDRMIESGERQLNLINSLLETHATENRGIKLNYEFVNIQALIQAITVDLEPLLLKNKATITNIFLSDLPIIHADALQLRRVFENLIINALNHNPPGLKITLQTSLETDNIRCLVQDNGVGMSEEQCLQLFERYARGNRARSTGIGLGLYLCRQIINAHGGEIGVTSSIGEGANFWFTLPIK